MGRGRRVDVCVDGAWFTREEDFLSGRYHGKQDLRNRRIFFAISFHFRYVRPCPVGLFYFGVFILY